MQVNQFETEGPLFKEVSGQDSIIVFPPPPPPPNGKDCECTKFNCCNKFFNRTQASVGLKGEKGSMGPRVSKYFASTL